MRVLGFTYPLGEFLAAWGGVAMLTSAPFDNWWHNVYGLDVKIVSPPHSLLVAGVFGVEIGSLFLIIAAMNRAQNDPALHRQLQLLLLYLSGMMLVLTMFFRMEFTWDIFLHLSGAYVAVAIGVPLYYSAMWKGSRNLHSGLSRSSRVLRASAIAPFMNRFLIAESYEQVGTETQCRSTSRKMKCSPQLALTAVTGP